MASGISSKRRQDTLNLTRDKTRIHQDLHIYKYTHTHIPMGRSQLPLPSLLSLFSALLMLSPQLLRVNAEDLYDAPINHPYVQKALAFAVERYNLDNEESANYFKVMQVLKTQWKRPNCHFAVVPHPLPIEMNVEISVCV